jgi:hypothetical protein
MSGLVERSERGRQISVKGMRHLGLLANEESSVA